MCAIVSESKGFIIGKSVKEEQFLEDVQGEFILVVNDVYCHVAPS